VVQAARTINLIVNSTASAYKSVAQHMQDTENLQHWRLAPLGLAVLSLASGCQRNPATGGWTPLFDGKTLSGWTAPDPGQWEIKEGVVTGRGPASHLFSPETYTNLEFKAEVKLNHGGNSGMYFRAAPGPGWPMGYEAQVENTSPDPQRTGSLYNLHPVFEQLVPDDTWWTQHIVAVGNRIIIKVNDKIVTDFVDRRNTFTSGHLALQQHNDGSVVEFRNAMVKRLPPDETSAWAEAKKDMPDLSDTPGKGN
jgi:hypothetical protein